MTRHAPVIALVAVLVTAVAVDAQRGRGVQESTTPMAAAPIDLTGTWVSIVSEDWRWRMVTPPKGDYVGVPLTPLGRKIADTWDLSRDVAEGNQCRAFGVGNVMRLPGRLKIAWEDANTLRIDADAGTQTRILHFDKAAKPAGEKSWQGWSVAEWELTGGGARGSAESMLTGDLKVVTTGMRAGYLRKNGVPYSENMVFTEYFDRHSEANGDEWFTVMSMAADPVYLTEPFIVTTSFRKERDSSKWRPTPCEMAPPPK
jgi:hypothetical protein